MIFFGTRSKVLGGEVIYGNSCSNCGTNQASTFGLLKYFHVYWIPMITYSKSVGMECLHCKKTLIGKDEVPSDIVAQAKSSLFGWGKILPYNIGVVLVSLLIMLGVYAIKQDAANEAIYLAKPAVNDFYIADFNRVFKDSDGDAEYKYGILRLKNVTGEQLEFQVSGTVYKRGSHANSAIIDGLADKDTYYSEELYSSDIVSLTNLNEAGAIYSIKRK